MAERYTRLFTIPENLYFYGSPIVIAAGALLKDNKTGKVLAQLKLRNIQRKAIKAVTVRIISYDVAGRRLGTEITYQYLDLVEIRDKEFGQKIPIMLPDATTRSFSVNITEVVFVDQSIWAMTADKWMPMKKRVPLNKWISDYQLENQFRIKYGMQCTDVFQEYQDLWYCSCGAVNRKEESSCHSCGLQSAVLAAINLNQLKAERDKRLAEEIMLQAEQKRVEERRRAEERVEQERRKEEERKAREIRERKAKKTRLILIIGSTITLVALIFSITAFKLYSNYVKVKQEDAAYLSIYNEAVTLLDSEKYDEAIELFSQLGDYRDSAVQLEQAENKEKEKRENAYKRGRTSISLGNNYTIGLLSDGTVVATGLNIGGRCNVSKWNNIISVSAGGTHTVGLCADGKVVAVGKNNYGQCDISKWTNIVTIAAGASHTVGLRSDGTVVAVGLNNYGQCDISKWTDIIAIAAGNTHTIGLCSDGTVVAVGRNNYNQCNISQWGDIIAIAAGDSHTVGLKADGTVVAVGLGYGGQYKFLEWTDIVAIAAGGSHTIGIHSDGTIVRAGLNSYEQYKILEWTDIVAVATRYSHTVGVHSNGTVIAVGENDSGECDVSDWKNIKLPDSY